MDWRELEALLPILFVVSTLMALIASLLFDYLKNKQAISLVMRLLETHPHIGVEEIRSITQPPVDPNLNAKRSALLIAISIACVLFSQSMMDPEYKMALLGLAAFPGLIGFVYLTFHLMSKQRASEEEH